MFTIVNGVTGSTRLLVANFTAAVLVGKLQTTSVEARPTDCGLPSLGSGLHTNNKPLLQANEVIFILYCVTLQGVRCLASPTSDYFNSLPAQTRERQLEKLRALAWKTCV